MVANVMRIPRYYAYARRSYVNRCKHLYDVASIRKDDLNTSTPY